MTETTIALVTGANKGIGHTVVRRLAEQGWTVLLGSRDAERGAAAAAELAGTVAGNIAVLTLDVTSDESVAAAAKEVEQRYGGWTSWSTTPASSARTSRCRTPVRRTCSPVTTRTSSGRCE
jgi:NAD(P)-dependent dehydrogenase (short-subunit alcohol dehydrogenase family)